MMTDGDELLTAAEVSRMTTLPVSTLHDYAVRVENGERRQGPVHLNLGPRRRRWMRADVERWLAGRRVGEKS